jgi:benzoyl-CoA reductase/2-hydroxyglutaryl-CoA dehydratase subunit BcrC/BadD/HgdB
MRIKMNAEKSESKYLEALPQGEADELRESAKSMSIGVTQDNIERMKKAWPNRPEAMKYFDDISELFGRRQEEIRAEKAKGKKIVGYFCMFTPVELILAADAIPVRINSGWYDSTKLGDRVVPVEVCPIIRSTIGAEMVGLSPLMEQCDAVVCALTCDGMTKLSEVLSDRKPMWTLSPPRVKDSEQSLELWGEEIREMKGKLEELTGNRITRDKLRPAIITMQKASKAFHRLQDLRRGPPVIMGRDAMLVNQTSTWDDIGRWTEKVDLLCDELEGRVKSKKWACKPETPRVMLTGTPMYWPDNWKVPTLIEEANPQGVLVADELCSSDRLLYDPVGADQWNMNDMLDGVAERYLMASTCPYFTSPDGNEDRINWLVNRIKECGVDGVIYHVVRGCMLYAMEYTRVKRALDRIGVPVYYLDTEYTREDVGQLKTRVEAFLEMLAERGGL